MPTAGGDMIVHGWDVIRTLLSRVERVKTAAQFRPRSSRLTGVDQWPWSSRCPRAALVSSITRHVSSRTGHSIGDAAYCAVFAEAACGRLPGCRAMRGEHALRRLSDQLVPGCRHRNHGWRPRRTAPRPPPADLARTPIRSPSPGTSERIRPRPAWSGGCRRRRQSDRTCRVCQEGPRRHQPAADT